MMPSTRIEDAIRSARSTTSAATDKRIMAVAEAAMARPDEQHPAPIRTSGSIRRTIMRRNWTRLATAAAVIAAIMLGMYALTGSVDGTAITLAQVRHAMQQIDWMQIINKGGDENETRGGPEIDWFSFTSKVHIGLCRGIVEYDDFGTGKRLWWNPAGKYISESPIDPTKEFAHGAAEPFEMIDRTFRIIQAEHGSNIARELGTYQGGKVEVWTVIRDAESGGSRTLTVYIDIERKLPIAATYDHTQPDGTVLRESNIEFIYPETGPADIYEAGAPRSATIKPAPDP
jgi:hypothetical protein